MKLLTKLFILICLLILILDAHTPPRKPENVAPKKPTRQTERQRAERTEPRKDVKIEFARFERDDADESESDPLSIVHEFEYIKDGKLIFRSNDFCQYFDQSQEIFLGVVYWKEGHRPPFLTSNGEILVNRSTVFAINSITVKKQGSYMVQYYQREGCHINYYFSYINHIHSLISDVKADKQCDD